MIKLANKRFTTIPNDYCLTFSQDALIERVEEDNQIQSVSFNFTALTKIEALIQSKSVEVIGVVLEVGPVSEIQLRDGQQKLKRSIKIGDESNICIGVTLWGPVAEAHPY